jgi:NAD(P)-dependent dehydrogenase (short-subunit alcohol dehydrogenase family)
MTNLSGKTALITGASRGIGRACAFILANAGAQVLVHYSSGEKEAAAVVAEIRKAGGKAEKITADLRTPDGPHTLAGPCVSMVARSSEPRQHESSPVRLAHRHSI